jgi:F-type H+-transporting ATPase subunit c
MTFAVVATLFAAIPALAQGQEAAAAKEWATGLGYIGAGVGFAIAAGLAALGQGKIASAACEGMARNPGAGGRIQTVMILGLAFVETLVIFTFVVVLLKI